MQFYTQMFEWQIVMYNISETNMSFVNTFQMPNRKRQNELIRVSLKVIKPIRLKIYPQVEIHNHENPIKERFICRKQMSVSVEKAVDGKIVHSPRGQPLSSYSTYSSTDLI